MISNRGSLLSLHQGPNIWQKVQKNTIYEDKTQYAHFRRNLLYQAAKRLLTAKRWKMRWRAIKTLRTLAVIVVSDFGCLTQYLPRSCQMFVTSRWRGERALLSKPKGLAWWNERGHLTGGWPHVLGFAPALKFLLGNICPPDIYGSLGCLCNVFEVGPGASSLCSAPCSESVLEDDDLPYGGHNHAVNMVLNSHRNHKAY